MRTLSIAALLLVALFTIPAMAADPKPAAPEPGGEKKKKDPAFAPVTDDPKLPRVLLIGDSISIGYTVAVREKLAGKANVHRIMVNGGPTLRGVEGIDAWLGSGKWDVIHFNFGLHDLKVMPDGKRQVEPDAYEANLKQIVEKLKKSGATLLWCSTTPVPEGKLNPPRTNDDVKAYNEVAAHVMASAGVATDDLYAFALPKLKEIQLPSNVHFTKSGSAVLAEQVSASIESALAQRK